MNRRTQIQYLILQELRTATRSKSIILSFIILPLLMWGFQGGFLVGMVNFMENQSNTYLYQDRPFYIANQDNGNENLTLGEQLIQDIGSVIQNQSSRTYGASMNVINEPHQFNDLKDMVIQDQISPLIFIPQNFTDCYTTFNQTVYPVVHILTNPGDQSFGWAILSDIFSLTNGEPYTSFTVLKQSALNVEVMTFEGEEDVQDTFIFGFIGFLTTILSVLAPVAYVSAAFAGEREKHTLEGLLVLPLRRIDIFLGKLLAGISFISIFSIMNILGLLFYQWLINSTADETNNPLTDGFEVTGEMILAIFLMVFLTAFIAIGVGIAIASFAKDSSTAEGVYMIVMMIPAVIVGMTTMLGGIPTSLNWLLIIPWTHSLSILTKLIYSNTYASSTITGSIFLDVLGHLGYLLLFVFGSMFLASKTFDREGILS